MSDPARDHAARKSAERREKIREEYTPLVIWVKTPEGGRIHEIRNWIQERVNSLPYVAVATKDVPYQYATDGELREEKADGNE